MSVDTKENVGFTQLTKRPQAKCLPQQTDFNRRDYALHLKQ